MKYIFLSFILFFSTISIFSQQGKLELAKESLRQSNSGNTTTEHDNNYSKSSSGYNPFTDLIVAIFYNITYGVAVETVFEKETKMHNAKISTHPYIFNKIGNYTYSDSINTVKTRFEITNSFVIENKNLFGNNFNTKLRFAKRFDIELGYLQLFENNNNKIDGFTLFSFMANYHRIRTQKIDLWYGIGASYVANNVDKFGFSYGVGTELFIIRPMSIVASYKGSIINDESINKFKILLNYHLKNYKIYSGYQRYILGPSKINTFSIGLGIFF